MFDLHLCVVEDHSTGEEAACTWETRAACGPGCREEWWKGVRSCCPLPTKPDMDWRLWSTMPAELVERILERLPASSQTRSQVVCKEWCSLLTSPAFLRRSALAALAARQSPSVLWETSGRRPQGTQDCVLRRSHKLKLDVISDYKWDYHRTWFDTQVFRGDRKGGAEDRRTHPCTYVRTWSEGLLCVYYEGSKPLGLHICVVNPVNRTWVELPYLAGISSLDTTSMMVVPGRGSQFRVMVLSSKRSLCPEHDGCQNCWFWCLNIYCSKTGAWYSTTSALCDPCSSKAADPCSHLVVNGLVYVVLGDPDDLLVLNGEDGKVVARLSGVGDGGIDGWGDECYGVPLESLVEHKGDVYCVALNSHACSMWKLASDDSSNPEWTHVSSYNWVWTAAHAAGEWGADCDDLFSCVVVGNRIYVSVEIFPHGDLLVSYNIRSGQWKTISGYAKMVLVPRPNLYLSNFVS